ncbi:MAG: hypothetical protein ACD_73C00311G0001, partial [uncultured bacterium]
MKTERFYRTQIAAWIKKIRHQQHLNQGEMASILGVSQAQFSKIERGQNSLTAEQFLILMAKFNGALTNFIPPSASSDEEEAILIRALSRFGAVGLLQNPETIIPEKYDQISSIILDILTLYPKATLLAHLAPLIANHSNQINYSLIAAKLNERLGSENRWWWILDHTLQAIQNRLTQSIASRKKVLLYQRAALNIESKIKFREKITRLTTHFSTPEDLMDESLTSENKVAELKNNRDNLA